MIIVSACDDGFVPGLLNLLYSTVLHNSDAEFYVVDAGMSEDSRQIIDRFASRNGITAHILLADKARLDSLPESLYWTSAIYARILIPELLPQYDRAIYIDADTTVVSDLTELWSTPLNGTLIAGVVDGYLQQSELDQVRVPREEYINSGVLVFDLALWRKERIAEKVFEYLAGHRKLIFPDQSAINAIVKGRVTFLERRWNFFSWQYELIPGTTPAIIHYTADNKPWNKRRAPLAAIYEAYRKLSGSEFPQPRDLPKFKNVRRTVIGLLTLRPKYWKKVYFAARCQFSFTRPHIERAMAMASERGQSAQGASKPFP